MWLLEIELRTSVRAVLLRTEPSEVGVKSSGTRVIDSHKPPCGCRNGRAPLCKSSILQRETQQTTAISPAPGFPFWDSLIALFKAHSDSDPQPPSAEITGTAEHAQFSRKFFGAL